MKSRVRVTSIVLVLILLVGSFGLAVPAITVDVQELGSGSGGIFSPTSTGTVCVPYAYVIYVVGWGWLGPYPINNIREVYTGNFTTNLYVGTNISIAIYGSSSLVSKGTKTLSGTLQAGYYTNVSINPSINSNQALNSDFHVTVQPPNYTSSSSGIISLLVQELGTGRPTGVYNDYAVLAYDGGLYQVYVILRCYELFFVPPVLSTGGFVGLAPAMLVLDKSAALENGMADPDSLNARRCHRPRLGNLPVIVRESPFIKEVVRKAMGEVMEKLEEMNSSSND